MTRAQKRTDRVRGRIQIQVQNWDWAKRQPGGVHLTIDRIVNGFRKRDERVDARDRLREARLEIAALKNEVARLGGK